MIKGAQAVEMRTLIHAGSQCGYAEGSTLWSGDIRPPLSSTTGSQHALKVALANIKRARKKEEWCNKAP